MKLRIKTLTLKNFKGVDEATYTFGDTVNIVGRNGAGKSTIMTSWLWLMANVDAELNTNPNVFPNGADKVTPKVTAVVDIDGMEVIIAKSQKRRAAKSKEEGKADSVSVTSKYEVNSVECTEKKFKEKLESYGVDMGKFLELSHPDVFTNQMGAKKDLEKMRNTLFSMGSTYTDLEVAQQTEGADETRKLLENYTKEEVAAMQTGKLRAIKEIYGNDGEILRAMIEGMEKSKVDIDVAQLEAQRDSLQEQITENKAKQEDISKQFEEQQKASDGILELKFKLSDLQRKANEENSRKRSDLESRIVEQKFLASQEERDIQNARQEILDLKDNIKRKELLIEDARKRYAAAQAIEFDENSLICPMCGQEYTREIKTQKMDDFERKKRDEVISISVMGNNAKHQIDNLKSVLEGKESEVVDHEETLGQINDLISELGKQFLELPATIDISNTREAQDISNQISEMEAAVNKEISTDGIRQQLIREGDELQTKLTEVEKQLALAERNAQIDERIADLRKKQRSCEQEKADAEKIKDQLSTIERRKNELMGESINRHFKIVEFKLFDWLKNGEYKSCCVPTYKGKDMGVSTNNGLEILMRLDIIKGLQKFFNMYFPVFVDNGECLDSASRKRTHMDAQCVFLTVTDNEQLQIIEE